MNEALSSLYWTVLISQRTSPYCDPTGFPCQDVSDEVDAAMELSSASTVLSEFWSWGPNEGKEGERVRGCILPLALNKEQEARSRGNWDDARVQWNHS